MYIIERGEVEKDSLEGYPLNLQWTTPPAPHILNLTLSSTASFFGLQRDTMQRCVLKISEQKIKIFVILREDFAVLISGKCLSDFSFGL